MRTQNADLPIEKNLNHAAAVAADLVIIHAIMERAAAELDSLKGGRFTPADVYTTVKAVHKINPLRLDALLAANLGNFSHDVNGMLTHYDYMAGRLSPVWSPRFSAEA